MTHATAQQVVDRHLPHWIYENPNIVFTCPKNSEIVSDLPVIKIGKAGHGGVVAFERFKAILSYMESTSHDWYTLHEYDSIIFDKIENLPKRSNVLTSNKLPTQPKPSAEKLKLIPEFKGYKGYYFLHPPLQMDHATLSNLNRMLLLEPADCEQGHWDRILGYVCEKYGIAMDTWGPLGFTRNTIKTYQQLMCAIESKKKWSSLLPRNQALSCIGINIRKKFSRLNFV